MSDIIDLNVWLDAKRKKDIESFKIKHPAQYACIKELGRKEGAITFCKSLIERFEKERIVLENERIILEQTMRQNHYADLDFSNALINIGKLLQLKEVLKEIKGSEKINE